MYKQLMDKGQSEDTNMSPNTNQTTNTSSNIPNNNTAVDKYNLLKLYIESSLPPVAPENEFNTPYEIATFLAVIDESYGSLFKVISCMIKEKLVPLQKSSIYNLLDLYLCKCLDINDLWSTITTPGKKALLSSQGFNYLVDYIQEKTLGGASITLAKIKNLVKERIIFEWNKKQNKVELQLPKICKTTLQKYASRIMCQKVFNIHSSILRKTESRATSEWSFRNTICYIMAVAATHFLIDVEPSELIN